MKSESNWRLGLASIFVIAASLGTVPGNDAAAANRQDPGYTVAEAALRAQPRLSAPVIARLERRTPVKVLAMRGRFAQVAVTGKQRGWVLSSLVKLGQSPAAGAGRSRAASSSASSSTSGWLRSITGFLGGGSRTRQQDSVTVGIRGLGQRDIERATPDPRAVDGLNAFQASEAQARQRAAKAGLRSRPFAYLQPRAVSAARPGSSAGSATGGGNGFSTDGFSSGSDN